MPQDFGREEGIIQIEIRLWYEKVPFQTTVRYSEVIKVERHLNDRMERESNPKQNKTSQQMNGPYRY